MAYPDLQPLNLDIAGYDGTFVELPRDITEPDFRGDLSAEQARRYGYLLELGAVFANDAYPTGDATTFAIEAARAAVIRMTVRQYAGHSTTQEWNNAHAQASAVLR